MLTRLVLLAALALLPACSFFSKTGPVVEEATTYTGPAIEFDSAGRTHIAVFTCPTGGWSASHDLTREGWPSHEVFITLVAPPDGSMNTQALTTLRVDTGVRSAAPCRIFVRRTDHAPDRMSQGVYRPAAQVEATATR